jgi:hypothetical protein
MELTILIVSSSTIWTSGTINFEMRAFLNREECLKEIPGFF